MIVVVVVVVVTVNSILLLGQSLNIFSSFHAGCRTENKWKSVP